MTEVPGYEWQRVAADVERRISGGELPPGSMLRGERAMAEEYGVALRNSEFRYVQVADDIEARIRAGEFPFDSRLPPRDVLAVDYHVGEMTVRRALRELAERDLVRPMPSVGTVVIWRPGHEEAT